MLELNKLYDILNNFNKETINQCIFKKSDLDSQILSNITNALRSVLGLNLNQNKTFLLILRCQFEEDKDIKAEQKCNDILEHHYKYEVPLFKNLFNEV